jgi:microcystin-dependent protein
MSEAYISQIAAFGFNFAPKSWAMCNGQTLSIMQNTALFSLLGTTYGGNGTTTFALPNLQSRIPVGFGTNAGQNQNYALGETGGEEQVTLTINELPSHMHLFVGASSPGNTLFPQNGAVLATVVKAGNVAGDPFYAPQASLQPLNPDSLSMTGGNLPHPNLQPYLTLNWCICQYGIFPSRN